MSVALVEARKLALEGMERLAAIAEERALTAEESAEFEGYENDVADVDRRMKLAAKAAELRSSQPADAPQPASEIRQVALAPTAAAPVNVEARAVSPYAKDNPTESWFADRRTIASTDASNAEVQEARQRLMAHYESVNDEGSARLVRTYSAGTTTEGGYLVAPQYLQSLFADLLSVGRTTADLVGKMALPASGKTFYLPTQDGATAVAVHTENNAITETTATFSQVQVDAARVAGAATLPNWLIDRSFPGADQIVLRDLAKVYAAKVNDIVLNSSTSNRKGLLQESGLGSATATAGTATIADILPAITNAISDVVGSYVGYPDAIVMHPRRWAWLSAQISTSHPALNIGAGGNHVGGFSSMNTAGQFQGPVQVGSLYGIPVYLDPAIPTNLGASTDEDRIIVMKRDEPILMESAPKFGVSTEAEFLKDQTLLRVTGDVAFTCARRKGAVSIVSGTALNDT